jgi:hypothetical protein
MYINVAYSMITGARAGLLILALYTLIEPSTKTYYVDDAWRWQVGCRPSEADRTDRLVNIHLVACII